MTATALPTRDHATGRFAPRAPIPVCASCRWTLAEDLCARTYCPHPKCAAYRKPVSVVQGADVGTLTLADIEPET